VIGSAPCAVLHEQLEDALVDSPSSCSPSSVCKTRSGRSWVVLEPIHQSIYRFFSTPKKLRRRICGIKAVE
jgi:hypothetical protein